MGAEIAALIQEEMWAQLRRPVQRIGAPSGPVSFWKPLETAFLTAVAQLTDAARALVRA